MMGLRWASPAAATAELLYEAHVFQIAGPLVVGIGLCPALHIRALQTGHRSIHKVCPLSSELVPLTGQYEYTLPLASSFRRER